MKVAVLMCGHVRSYTKCRENFFRAIIAPLQKTDHSCDIFFSTWNEYGFQVKVLEGKIDATQIMKDSTDCIIEESSPNNFADLFTETGTQQYGKYSVPPEKGVNATSMWYRVFKCYKLMEKQGKYDIVIRTRPDLYYETPINVNWLKFCEKNTVYMPFWHKHFRAVAYTMMDHFAFGDAESMRVYCETYKNIEKCIEENKHAFTGEGFLWDQLNRTGINIERIPMHYGIQRITHIDPITRYKCGGCRQGGKCDEK